MKIDLDGVEIIDRLRDEPSWQFDARVYRTSQQGHVLIPILTWDGTGSNRPPLAPLAYLRVHSSILFEMLRELGAKRLPTGFDHDDSECDVDLRKQLRSYADELSSPCASTLSPAGCACCRHDREMFFRHFPELQEP